MIGFNQGAKQTIKTKQKGLVFIAFIFLLGMAVTAVSIGMLANSSFTIEKSVKDNEALATAKAALIGNVLRGGSNNSIGQFPCAEDVTSIGSASEGQSAPSCSNTNISYGRFAWRTLGTGDIKDGNNDSLWYVLSSGYQSPPINSDSIAGLNVNEQQNHSIALLFSSGVALSNQSRSTPTSPSSAPVISSYLDAENNNLDNEFISGKITTSFNDKFVSITADDIFPVLEKRVLGEVKNYLVSYESVWGALPFPSTFANPSSPSATFIGSITNKSGLLPVGSPENTSSTDDDISWSGATWTAIRTSNGAITTGSCGSESQVITCTFSLSYGGAKTIIITANLNNVGIAFYKQMSTTSTADFRFSPAATMTVASRTLSYNLNASGGGTVTLKGASTRRGNYTITFLRPPQLDNINLQAHPLKSIYQNNWHHLIYYQVAESFLPGGNALCGNTCLSANRINVTPQVTSAGGHGVLISAGRRLNVSNLRPSPTYSDDNPAQIRPSNSLADYFDSTNNVNGGLVFDTTTKPLETFNDQVELIKP